MKEINMAETERGERGSVARTKKDSYSVKKIVFTMLQRSILLRIMLTSSKYAAQKLPSFNVINSILKKIAVPP